MAEQNPASVNGSQSSFVNTVYFIGVDAAGPIKIGHAISPTLRLKSLQTSSPHTLRIFAAYGFNRHDAAVKVEAACHAAASARRMSGEWFRLTMSEAKAIFVAECARLGLTPRRWRPSRAQIENRARLLDVHPEKLGPPASDDGPEDTPVKPMSAAQVKRQTRDKPWAEKPATIDERAKRAMDDQRWLREN